MSAKLLSFIKLPGYNQFDYKPRHYDPNKERREKGRRKIKFKTSHFESDSPIVNQFRKHKHYSRQKVRMTSLLIRVIIIVLLVAMIWLIFEGWAAMHGSSLNLN